MDGRAVGGADQSVFWWVMMQNTIFSLDGKEQLQGISGVRREGLGQGHSVPHIHREAGSHDPLGGRHSGERCEEVQ